MNVKSDKPPYPKRATAEALRKKKYKHKDMVNELWSTTMVNKIDEICDYQIPSHSKIDIIKAEIKRWREK